MTGRRISAADVIGHFQGECDGEAFFLGSDDDLGMDCDSSCSENELSGEYNACTTKQTFFNNKI